MKSNYSFNAELISNRKFTKEELGLIKNEIEANEDFPHIYQIFAEVIEINFNGYIEIYIDSIPFDVDLSIDIEDMMKRIDSLIKGGWSNDSKVEFYSIKPTFTYIWYKDGKEWKESAMNTPKTDFFPEDDSWEDPDEDFYTSNYYPDYDDEDDSNW